MTARRYGAKVPGEPREDAALVLQTVKVNGSSALVSAYSDHLSIVQSDGTRTIPINAIARISHRTGLRSRLNLVLQSGEEVVIRGLKAKDVQRAYWIIVQLASRSR
jgi:hypothetical protein